MPPRKKAATLDTSAPTTRRTRATRSATAAASTAAADSVAVPDASSSAPAAAPKTTSKRAAKRTRPQSADDDEASPAKKAKAASQPVQDDAEQDDDEAKDAKAPSKMVTVIKRGAAPVDPSSGLVLSHQVFVNAECVWDAMLNQTEVKTNKNKFYVIQLLHPIGNNSSCTLFTHWGRVGENGQTQSKGPFPSALAVNEFKKQFRSKTGSAWEQRVGMTPKPGKYFWLERGFDEDEKEEEDKEEGKSNGKKKAAEVVIPDSQLRLEIQTFCKLIFSTSLIDAHLSSMNYDAQKLPLGKLAKSTILNGFAALKALAEVIEDPTGDKAAPHGGKQAACEYLSGMYYSVIPHVFGRNRPTVINNMTLLKQELDLVDALGDMEIAQELISSSTTLNDQGEPINPLDAHFRSLGLTAMEPVARDCGEFITLQSYVRDTHGETHRHYQVDIINAFRVEREQETEAWNRSGFDRLANGDRLLLWHGSRTTNFAGILKQGLRIAPPEAPVTGYMFGKGVYFADMMSKSANYCYAHLSNNTGVLLLCEVVAKPVFEQVQANYNADQDCRNNKKLATLGLGLTQPGKWKDAGQALNNPALDGCSMPDGPGVSSSGQQYLQYNEYIVYDTSQIRLRYLLMVRMG